MAIVYFYPEKTDRTPGMYLNITNKCTSNCVFCLRNFQDFIGRYKLKLDKEPSLNELWDKIQERSKQRNFSEVVFCGLGEPLTRLDDIVLPLSTRISEYFPDTPLRVDTNGQAGLLHPGRNVPRELYVSGVDRVSVSLNAESPEKYYRLCRPNFPDLNKEEIYLGILNFIRGCSNAELETTATALEFALDNLPVELHPDLDKTEQLAKYMGAKELKIRPYKGPDLRSYFNQIKYDKKRK